MQYTFNVLCQKLFGPGEWLVEQEKTEMNGENRNLAGHFLWCVLGKFV